MARSSFLFYVTLVILGTVRKNWSSPYIYRIIYISLNGVPSFSFYDTANLFWKYFSSIFSQLFNAPHTSSSQFNNSFYHLVMHIFWSMMFTIAFLFFATSSQWYLMISKVTFCINLKAFSLNVYYLGVQSILEFFRLF